MMKKRNSLMINLGVSLVVALVLTGLTARIQLSIHHPLNLIGRVVTGAGVDYTTGFPVPITVRTLPGQMISEPQTLGFIIGWPANLLFYWIVSFMALYFISKLVASRSKIQKQF